MIALLLFAAHYHAAALRPHRYRMAGAFAQHRFHAAHKLLFQILGHKGLNGARKAAAVHAHRAAAGQNP